MTITYSGDKKVKSVKAAIANKGTAAPAGCSDWFLPSGYQWKQMIAGAGSDENLLSIADLGTSATYWTSTEKDNDNVWRYYSGGNFDKYGKTTSSKARACLAF